MTIRRFVQRTIAIIVAVAALAGCSGGKAKSALSTDSTSDIHSTFAITTAPTTSTSSTTTTGVNGCGAGPRPANAIRVSEATGDFDGDGTPDTLVVYGTGNDATPAPYVVRVELGGTGGSVETPIVDAATDPNQNVKALGGSEISARSGLPSDGSGVEAFVAVGSGASTSLVGIYQLVACNLIRLSGAGGPVALPVGGTVTHLSGLHCDGISGGVRLVRISAESADGVTYDTSEQILDVTGGKLVPPGPPVKGSLGGNDPDLPRFSGLDCPGVDAL